jgi:methyl-accepting chemotaxis protein
MMIFKNMKVTTKLLSGFALVLTLLVIIGIFSMFELHAENEHVAQMRDHWLPSVRSSLQMRVELGDLRLSEYQNASAPNDDELKQGEKFAASVLSKLRESSAEYEKLISEPEEKAAYADIQGQMPKYLQARQQMLTLAKAGKRDDARSILAGQSRTAYNAIYTDLNTILDANVSGTAREGADAAQAYSHAVALVIAFTILAGIVGLTSALLIARGLSRQLGGEPGDAVVLAAEIASGNLTRQLTLKAGDSSSLMYSLCAMKQQLTTIVGGIKSSSTSISVAAGEIAQGNVDLSQRTEEQAASLEETAASMEELTATVRQNTESATRASSLAKKASDVAIRGGSAVTKVVQTMNGISDSSNGMAEIIAVIESISFQTNILALNAAVEAARAGEQGRGFAVVASEVRALAQRSATAAKEIKDLISDSAERVSEGTAQVANAGSTMDEVVRSVKHVADIIGEIASASSEQSNGIEQVNVAVSQMDQVTQQNAALVEQASAAAHAMAEQATRLRDAVAIFKVSELEASSPGLKPADSRKAA